MPRNSIITSRMTSAADWGCAPPTILTHNPHCGPHVKRLITDSVMSPDPVKLSKPGPNRSSSSLYKMIAEWTIYSVVGYLYYYLYLTFGKPLNLEWGNKCNSYVFDSARRWQRIYFAPNEQSLLLTGIVHLYPVWRCVDLWWPLQENESSSSLGLHRSLLGNVCVALHQISDTYITLNGCNNTAGQDHCRSSPPPTDRDWTHISRAYDWANKWTLSVCTAGPMMDIYSILLLRKRRSTDQEDEPWNPHRRSLDRSIVWPGLWRRLVLPPNSCHTVFPVQCNHSHSPLRVCASLEGNVVQLHQIPGTW